MKTFKSTCGCEIHVIKWSAKAESVTVQSCSLHKAAPDLLSASKEIMAVIDPWVSERSSVQMIEAHANMIAAIKSAEGCQ